MASETPTGIPTVDLSSFREGTDVQNRQEVVQQLAQACRHHGCVGITGHGVSSQLLAAAFDLTKRIFDLSTEDKLKAPHPQAPTPHRGYSPPGMEKAYSKSDLETDDEARKAVGRKTVDYKVQMPKPCCSKQNNLSVPIGGLRYW